MAKDLNIAEQFLEKLGLKYEDLDKPGYMGEKEAYFDLLKQTQLAPLSVDEVRNFILRCRYSVEMELTDPKHNTIHDEQLKARLRNYILLEAFLYAPANAVEVHKEDIKALVSNKK